MEVHPQDVTGGTGEGINVERGMCGEMMVVGPGMTWHRTGPPHSHLLEQTLGSLYSDQGQGVEPIG